MTQEDLRSQVLKCTFGWGWEEEGLGYLKLNLSSTGSQPKRSCLNCRAGLIWGSDHRQRVPTAVPMGTVSGRAPAQNEQPAWGLNPAGVTWAQGWLGPPTAPSSGAQEGLQLQGRGGQVTMETKLLAFPGAWSSDREAGLRKAPWPLSPSSPSQLASRAIMGTETDDGLRGAGKAVGLTNWQ